MSALIGRLAPWLLIALAIAGVVTWGLWGRLNTVQTKLDTANGVIEQAEKDKAANAKAVQQLARPAAALSSRSSRRSTPAFSNRARTRRWRRTIQVTTSSPPSACGSQRPTSTARRGMVRWRTG